MKKSILHFRKYKEGGYHAVFKNTHARIIYLALSKKADTCVVEECYYLDRSTKKVPKALTFKPFECRELADKISKELDKTFSEIRFLDNQILTKDELISSHLCGEKRRFFSC